MVAYADALTRLALSHPIKIGRRSHLFKDRSKLNQSWLAGIPSILRIHDGETLSR